MKYPENFWRSAVAGTLLLGMGILLIVVHVNLYHYPFDDSYIHFRIAKYLALYKQPYFNQSEAVNASSSPAWTMILYLIIQTLRVFGSLDSLPLTVAIANALFTLGGAAVYTLLLAKITRAKSLELFHLIFFVIYIAIVLVPSIGMMESPAVLLIIGISVLLLANNDARSCIGFGLAPFLRPEFAVILFLALIYILVLKPFPYRAAFLYFILGLLPFTLYLLFYFGTLVPHTVLAKSRVYILSYNFVYQYILSSSVPNLIQLKLKKLTQPAEYSTLALYAATAVYIAARKIPSLWQRVPDFSAGLMLIMLGWGSSIIAAYLLEKTNVTAWYVPLYLVPIWFCICSFLLEVRSRSAIFLPALLLAFPLVVLNFMTIYYSVLGAATDPTIYPDFAEGARVRHYLEVGAQLQKEYPQAAIMTSEIGGLGYSFDGYIYDGVGLVSPAALKYHPMKVRKERSYGYIGAIPVDFIREVLPDIIVSYDIFIEAFLRDSLKDQYVQVKYPLFVEDDMARTGPVKLWNSEYLNVFIRKDEWDYP